MSRFSSWIRGEIRSQTASPASAAAQYIIHIVIVYAVAGYCLPWLAWAIHDAVIPALLHQTPKESTWQFFFSNLLGFSLVCGLLAGFLNATILSHPIVRFVWVVPFALLALAFVFTAPGVYPTMILQSDFGEAFHYTFGGGFNIPHSYSTYRELWTGFSETRDLLRGLYQFRVTVPAYTGVAYSFGAWLSIRLRKARAHSYTADRTAA
jgi:hypothetical protein